MSWSSLQEEFSRPSPKDGYYDVFISFRGPDTRSGFTDTLHRSLLESEVYTFIDADLAGKTIETLFKIIGISRIAVVVYSESFASSHWCLTELETIMQRWEEKKMLMLPIFYKVDTQELKHPTERTTKYFDEHIKEHGEPLVRKWKDVVTKIGNVSGFPYKDVSTRTERDFIMTHVITTIKKKLKELGKTSLESSTSNPYNIGPAATENHHDVFISFLGKDTRYDLVNYLYENLMIFRKDIKIFMEDRDYLKKDNIFEVIQRSKMSVVIFSKNYASSKWCLRELVKILQCSNTTGQELLPIFYEQADNERIAHYLKWHERDEELATVESWRDAITELDNTVGWRYSTTKSKSDFIQRLVEEISIILNRLDEKKESEHVAEVDTELIEKEEEEIQGELVAVEKLELQEKELSCNDEQQQADESFVHTTTGEGVYRVITSAYFQKSSYEMKGNVLNIKPMDTLYFYVELNKESSSCLLLTNTTDNYVAFKIQFEIDDQALKYRVCPNEGLVLPRSTFQVIEAQSILPPYLECSDKFIVQSVIIKKDSYSMDDFSDMFKKWSGTPIQKQKMDVCYFPTRRQESSILDHRAQLASKGLIIASERVKSIDTHPKKPWVLLGLSSNIICIWNCETRVEEKSFEVGSLSESLACAKFVHEKHWIVVGIKNGIVRVYDYNTLRKVKEFRAHEKMITHVAVHPTLPYVLTSMDKLVKLWNWENDWACTATFEGNSDIVVQVAFNPNDSASFASMSWNGTIKIWNFNSSVAKFTINAHDKPSTCVEYYVGNNNKLYILNITNNNIVRVWDYESKTLLQTLEGHLKYVEAILVHPELPIIITGSRDKTIRIWNKNTYQLELVWTCDLGEVYSIGYIKATDEVVLGCHEGMMVIKIVDDGTLSN